MTRDSAAIRAMVSARKDANNAFWLGCVVGALSATALVVAGYIGAAAVSIIANMGG